MAGRGPGVRVGRLRLRTVVGEQEGELAQFLEDHHNYLHELERLLEHQAAPKAHHGIVRHPGLGSDLLAGHLHELLHSSAK